MRWGIGKALAIDARKGFIGALCIRSLGGVITEIKLAGVADEEGFNHVKIGADYH